jgi:hypothetical protein
MIKHFSCSGAIFLLLLALSFPAFSEPYSPSCQTAVERVIKAQKFLIPFQRTIELSRASERIAYAELAVCAGGGIFSVNKAFACNEASWKAPQQTKEVIAAEDEYLQNRNAFEELFEQAGMACLPEP